MTFDGVRRFATGLPEVEERLTWDTDITFRVRDKIFAMQHGVDGRPSMWCKAPPGAQQALVSADPERFFVPPYVGCHGWIGHWLDIPIDWDELADLVDESYRMTAPKRLCAQIAR